MRPAENHTPSPSNAATTAAHSTWEKTRFPLAIAEPAKTSTGIAGSGTPSRVASTLAKTAALPQFSIADGGICIKYSSPEAFGVARPPLAFHAAFKAHRFTRA